MMRHGNTATEMTTSGQWAKVGRKHYRHESGAEVRYDDNAWTWVVSTTGRRYERLWAARAEAERAA